jgi:hypothetical protein
VEILKEERFFVIAPVNDPPPAALLRAAFTYQLLDERGTDPDYQGRLDDDWHHTIFLVFHERCSFLIDQQLSVASAPLRKRDNWKRRDILYHFVFV